MPPPVALPAATDGHPSGHPRCDRLLLAVSAGAIAAEAGRAASALLHLGSGLSALGLLTAAAVLVLPGGRRQS